MTTFNGREDFGKCFLGYAVWDTRSKKTEMPSSAGQCYNLKLSSGDICRTGTVLWAAALTEPRLPQLGEPAAAAADLLAVQPKQSSWC